jgi:hypothetical protein
MRFLFLVLSMAATLPSCTKGTEPEDLAGSYSATVFKVTPAGQATIDVLAAGGSLTITITGNNTTSGTLSIPASLNGGVPFTASMEGTVTLSGSTVAFQQTADTFVRDLSWTFAGNSLSVSNQLVSGDAHTLTLTK